MYLERITPTNSPNHIPSWSEIMSFTRLQLDGRFRPRWWLGVMFFPLRIFYRTMAFPLLIDSLWLSRVRSWESWISFYSSNGPKWVTSNFGLSIDPYLRDLACWSTSFLIWASAYAISPSWLEHRILCVRQSWVLSLWFNGYCFASFHSWLQKMCEPREVVGCKQRI